MADPSILAGETTVTTIVGTEVAVHSFAAGVVAPKVDLPAAAQPTDWIELVLYERADAGGDPLIEAARFIMSGNTTEHRRATFVFPVAISGELRVFQRAGAARTIKVTTVKGG